MIVLYTLLVLLLGVAKLLVDWRVRAMERKYSRVAREATNLANEPVYRPGNSNRQDPFLSAKRQYRLALFAETRDRLEARNYAWQRVADRLGGALRRVRSWKGRKLPYTFGAVDVSLVLYLIDRYGLQDQAGWASMVETVQTLFTW
jgi:hypothetical protein